MTLSCDLPAGRSRELALTAQVFSGDEALQWGLVTHTFPTASALAVVSVRVRVRIVLGAQTDTKLRKRIHRSGLIEEFQQVIDTVWCACRASTHLLRQLQQSHQ